MELQQLLERISVDNTLVDLKVDEDDSRKVLIREVQHHPWKPQLLHVDFFQIREDEEIRVSVPVEFTGTPMGVTEDGGILQTTRDSIEIECLPTEIPEFFEIDVSELEIGDSLHIADLNTGGVRPLEDLDATLCVVVPPTVIAVEEETEAEAELEELEPELVGEEGEEVEGEEPEIAEGEEPPESPEDLL
jgi:large subunit ribosomal protein L25